jgi:hypothetical protein
MLPDRTLLKMCPEIGSAFENGYSAKGTLFVCNGLRLSLLKLLEEKDLESFRTKLQQAGTPIGKATKLKIS